MLHRQNQVVPIKNDISGLDKTRQYRKNLILKSLFTLEGTSKLYKHFQ